MWSIWPQNKSIVDPVLGNVTGTGSRNIGDTIGSVKLGIERGKVETLNSANSSTSKQEPFVDKLNKNIQSLNALCPKCGGRIKRETEACNHCNAWLGANSDLKPVPLPAELMVDELVNEQSSLNESRISSTEKTNVEASVQMGTKITDALLDIEKISELKKIGAISEDEFQSLKMHIISTTRITTTSTN